MRCMEKKSWIYNVMKPHYSKQILPFPWFFVILRFHCISKSFSGFSNEHFLKGWYAFHHPTLGSCVEAACKVSPDWLQKTMTCHSFNCFSIVWGQGWAPLVTSFLSSCSAWRVRHCKLCGLSPKTCLAGLNSPGTNVRTDIASMLRDNT